MTFTVITNSSLMKILIYCILPAVCLMTCNPNKLASKKGKPSMQGKEEKYEVNNYLEPLVLSDNNNSYTFKIERPTKGEFFTRKSDTHLEIKGYFYSDGSFSEGQLALYIFSNSKEDYINNNYVSSAMMPLKKKGNKLFFQLKPLLPSEEGLYYYVISLEKEEEPLFVGKFQLF